MKVIKLKDLSQKDYQRIVNRSTGTNRSIMPVVRTIMEKVQKEGGKIIIEKYQQRCCKLFL